jgi:hypothetical protein
MELQADRTGRQVKLLRRMRHAGRFQHRKKQFQLMNVHLSSASPFFNVPKSPLEFFWY